MNAKKNIIKYGFICIMLLIVILVIYMMTKKNKDGFCTCMGMSSKRCPNPENLQALYNSGQLTENTDLEKIAPQVWQTNIMPKDAYDNSTKNIGWYPN